MTAGTTEAKRRWSRENRDRHNALKRKWEKIHAEASAASKKRWRTENRERLRIVNGAGHMVRGAVAMGLLKRPSSCEWCGVECYPDAAHHDYSKPLYVDWLCKRCHREYDLLFPKTLRRS